MATVSSVSEKKILINLGLKQSDQVIIISKSLRAFFL